MEVQDLVNQITQAISLGAGLGVLLGLSEWLVKFFLSAVFDRFNFKG